MSAGDETGAKMDESLAHCTSKHLSLAGTSFRNRVGPTTEPWGTPDKIVERWEHEPPYTTCWLRPRKNLEFRTRREPRMPVWMSLLARFGSVMPSVWNALLRSSKKQACGNAVVYVVAHKCVMLARAVSELL